MVVVFIERAFKFHEGAAKGYMIRPKALGSHTLFSSALKSTHLNISRAFTIGFL